MNTICPRCGKVDTIPFSDSVLHTVGFECANCHQDFGVDDGILMKKREENLISFSLTEVLEDHSSYTVKIIKEDAVKMEFSKTLQDGRVQSYYPVDFTAEFDKFTIMLFESLFVMDWNNLPVTEIKPGEPCFKIQMSFEDDVLPKVTIRGKEETAPYFKVLHMLFTSLFEKGEEND